MEDLITVIVPIYNVEKFLDQCVNSIIHQTYRNLEIILVDDGSPDHCPQICDTWAEKDPRIYVIHKQNQGLGMARNTGIEHATGKYICFLDSDDYIAHNTIEKAYVTAIRTCSDIVVFGMKRVNDANEVVHYRKPETPQECFCGKEVQEVFLPDLIDNSHRDVRVKNLGLSACSCLFSMQLIRKTNWRFVSERELISEDGYSLIWLYQYVQCVAIVPEGLYYYRMNSSSLTQTYRSDRCVKNRLFYMQCAKMAKKQGLGEEVQKSIAALFLGFTMSAMKLLVESNLCGSEKIGAIRESLEDATLQKTIERVETRNYGWMKKLLFWVMKRKWCWVCYLLFVLRGAMEKARR